MTGVSPAPYTAQQQCGVANLPAFGDRRDDNDEYLGRPSADRLQAIVPAYTFNCTGRVAEWRACVDQGGGRERYYIQFQVWRPTGVPGCYRLVGSNAPPEPTFDGMGEVNNTDQLLRPVTGRKNPLDHCVLLPVSEDEQIEFQPGDVIGYYADRFREKNNDHDDPDPDNGGVQVVRDENVVVYNKIDVPLDDLKTQYAIPALGPDPSSCGFELEGSDSSLFQLNSSISGAPILNLSLVTIVVTNGMQPTPTSSPSLTPTQSVNDGGGGGFSPPSSSVSFEDGGGGGGGGDGSRPNLLMVVAIPLVLIIITIGM